MTVRLEALPELLELWRELERAAAAEGIAIAVADYGGFRTAGDTTQIEAFKQRDYDAYAARERAAGRVPVPITGPWEDGGSRPIAPYGSSWHNYGAARDFRISKRPAGMTVRRAEDRVAELAVSIGLRSGRSYGDRWHVELPISLEEARRRWAEYSASSSSSSSSGSMTAVWVLVAIGVGIVATIRYANGLRSWH